MSLIKLASQTVLALKGVFRAAKNDVKSLSSNAKHRMVGAVQGFEHGGIGQYNEKLKNINTTLDQKLRNLRHGMKVQSIKNQAALSDQAVKHQAKYNKFKSRAKHIIEKHQAKYNKFKSRAKHIIEKHKTREGMLGVGIAGVTGGLTGATIGATRSNRK